MTYLVYSKLFTPDKKIERVTEEKSDNMRMFTGKEYVNKAFSIPISTRMGTYNESTAQKEAVATAFRNPISTPSHNGLFTEEKECLKKTVL